MIFGKLFNRPKTTETLMPQEFLDLQKAKDELNKIKQESTLLEEKINNMRESIRQKTFVLNELNANLESAESKIIAQDIGLFYEPPFEKLKIGFIEYDIVVAKETLTKMVKNKEYYTATKEYTVDNSVAKGRAFVNAFCENNILGFNLYCEKKKKGLTIYNFSDTMELIDKAFARYDKKLHIIHAYFNPKYLETTKNWLKLELDLKVKKQQEKERIREEKRKLREEQQLLAEAEKERKKLEEERKAMDIAFNKALTDAEREQIKNKLAEIDKRIANVDYRVANPKAGWVYIIHSDSLPELEKIGVSRRLSGPHERIKELSGSSLPTPFMLDAFCFSDDAFELESNLHKYFDKQRVNPNKEFFRITAQEAINAMENVFNYKAHIVNLEDSDSKID